MADAPNPPGIGSSTFFRRLKITNSVITDDFQVDYIISSSVNVNVLNNGNMSIVNGNIYNSSSLNEVVIEKHGSRHNFNGDDPLTPGIVSDIKELTDFNASSGISSSIPRADHVHFHGNRAGGVLHSVCSRNSNGFMTSLDKNKLDFFIEPSNVIPIEIGGISLPGTLNKYSRSDHTHKHGIQMDSSMHNISTETTNGFLSLTDKTKINQFNFVDDVLILSGVISVISPVSCFVFGNTIVNIPENTNYTLSGTYFTNPTLNGITYNNGYIVPSSGCYMVQLNSSMFFPISSTYYTISILINYSVFKGKIISNNSGYRNTTDNTVLNTVLNENDIISIVINHSNGGTNVVSDISTNSKLSIIKLS